MSAVRIQRSTMVDGYSFPGAGMPPVLGGYRILRLLGQGGMGQVYEVELEHASAPAPHFALKVLNPFASDEHRERFKREILIGTSIQHPNVCEIVDFGFEEDGAPYLVMELLTGQNLADCIRDWAPLPMPVAHHVITEVLNGLQAIHDAGVIHRDLKPANIYLSQEGRVKIVDFGIARGGDGQVLTKTGLTVGSLDYMSPEQMVSSKTVDHRADIFNVGIILFQMLTGHLPFEDGDQSQLFRLLNGDRTPILELRPDLPLEVELWLDCAMAMKVTQRFPSARAALDALTF